MEEDFYTEDMDDVFLGTPEEYEANWVGVPWYERTEEPPQWEDFWQD